MATPSLFLLQLVITIGVGLVIALLAFRVVTSTPESRRAYRERLVNGTRRW